MQWPILPTRFERQKVNKPVDGFSNLLSPPNGVKACLVLIDVLFTLLPSTAKCEHEFSTMSQLKNAARTLMNQDTLPT